jgi:peptidoglycan/LPS O-acetylase OafA/YrhL
VALYAFDAGIFTHLDKFKKVVTSGPTMTLSYIWTNTAVLGQDMLFLLGIDPETYTFYWDPEGTARLKAWSFLLVPQAWSLSMEWYFYLAAPFLLRLRVIWIVLIFVGSLCLRLYIVSQGSQYDLLVRRLFPSELCLFLAGYFSYLLFKHVRRWERKHLMGLFSWAALVTIFVFYNHISEKYSLVLLALMLTFSMPFIFSLSKDSKMDRFLGNLSFSVYMVHFLIIEFLDDYIHEYSIWMILPLILLSATGVYWGLERPIDRWRQRRLKPELSSKDRDSADKMPLMVAVEATM